MQELLMLALSLLIAAQSPNVPESVRIQAVSVAKYAIEVSMATVPVEAVKPVASTTVEVEVKPEIVYPFCDARGKNCGG